MAEAKAKIKARHAEAIGAYKAWLEEHPNATLTQKFRHFNLCVDTAELNKKIATQETLTPAG
jgi:hypothetical protein